MTITAESLVRLRIANEGKQFPVYNDYDQVRKRQLNINGVKVTLDMPVRRKRWELRHKMVKLEKELGSGSYGVVYRGTLTFPAKKPFVVGSPSNIL